MADDLSFTISAQDQASRVVETVQKKIQGFGTDLAKMALGVAGPMALVSLGIGLIMDKWNEYKQSKIDAKNDALREEENIAKLATEKELANIKKIEEAYKKAEAEKTAARKKEEENRQKKLTVFQEIEQLKAELNGNGPLTGFDALTDLGEKLRDAQRDYSKTRRLYEEGGRGVTALDVGLAEKKKLEAELALKKENEKQDIENTKAREQNKQSRPEEVKAVKDTIKVTVSSLREIGGSFGGGDVNTGIETQIDLARAGNALLTTIANNTSYMKTDSNGNPILVGDTNFTLPGGKQVSSYEDLINGNF